jgi:hypothetical protein
MDLKSLNHQASYLIAGLNYFANSDLTKLKAQEDDVYFNFPYFGLVFYPFSWILPIFIGCLIVFFALLFVGFQKKKLTLSGVIKGFIPFKLSLFTSGLLAFFGWKLLLKIYPKYYDILQGFTYNGSYYIVFFVALSIAIFFWFYKRFFKKETTQDLLIAPLTFWILINGGIVFYLQGAGFFSIPVILTLIVLAVYIFSANTKNNTLFFTFLAIPILFIFSPFIAMFPVGLGLKMLVISSVFTILILGLLLPIFQSYRNNKNLGNLFLLIAGMAFISASINSSYSSERKLPNSMLYVLDTAKNEAFWASYNSKTDEFTEQFLGKNPTIGNYDANTTASKYKTNIQLHTKAPIIDLQKPSINIVTDTLIGNNRKIVLQILSNRNANKVELLTKTPIQFKAFKVNNEALKIDATSKLAFEVKNGTIMSYFLTQEHELIELEFLVAKQQKFDMDVLEIKFDLLSNPFIKMKQRNEMMIPMPFVLNDATIIKTNLTF